MYACDTRTRAALGAAAAVCRTRRHRADDAYPILPPSTPNARCGRRAMSFVSGRSRRLRDHSAIRCELIIEITDILAFTARRESKASANFR